jgi:hypothetical protein
LDAEFSGEASGGAVHASGGEEEEMMEIVLQAHLSHPPMEMRIYFHNNA